MTKGYFLWELNIEVNREVPSRYLLSLANGTPQVTDKHKPLLNAILRDFPNEAGETFETLSSEPLVDKELPLSRDPHNTASLLNNLERSC